MKTRQPVPIAGVISAKRAEKFWKAIKKTEDGSCWLWTLCTDPNGYGICGTRVGTKCQALASHRVAYYLHTGIDPLEKYVCHRCDNPPCCNPEHLFLGTQADNMADAARKGRAKGPSGLAAKGHAKLTPDIVRQVRRRVADGEAIRSIAREYAVSFSAIWRIVKRLSWNDID